MRRGRFKLDSKHEPFVRRKISDEFSELGKMLSMLYHLPQITIAMVHGTVYGEE